MRPRPASMFESPLLVGLRGHLRWEGSTTPATTLVGVVAKSERTGSLNRRVTRSTSLGATIAGDDNLRSPHLRSLTRPLRLLGAEPRQPAAGRPGGRGGDGDIGRAGRSSSGGSRAAPVRRRGRGLPTDEPFGGIRDAHGARTVRRRCAGRLDVV